MPETPKSGSISPTDFLATMSRYDAFTSSPAQAKRQTTEPRVASEPAGRPSLESLQELDAWRNFTLPAAIEARRKEGRAYISHDELVNLMKCKMKRGKFRPQLLPQVASNNAAMVEKVTAQAFEYNKDWKADEKPDLDNVKSALGHLSKNLKGVGPATASYILAAQMPSWIPAFSDEGFRWVVFDKHIPGVIEGTAKSTEGWQRPIKYSLKEYFAYVDEVWDISDRLIADYNRDDGKQESKNVKSARELFGAGSIEMVGWVFGKESAGWRPRTPEKIGNGAQTSKAAETKQDEPEDVTHDKRKNGGGSEKQENLGVDRQNPEVDQDEDSKGPREAKRRKSKIKEDGDSASKPKAKGRGASSKRASNLGGLRRSSRIRTTAMGTK